MDFTRIFLDFLPRRFINLIFINFNRRLAPRMEFQRRERLEKGEGPGREKRDRSRDEEFDEGGEEAYSSREEQFTRG